MFTLAAIAEKINATVHGDASIEITGIGTLEEATAGQITFLDNPKYKRYLVDTQASVVILRAEMLDSCQVNALIVDDPYVAYAKTAQLFYPQTMADAGIHPTAMIDETALIDASAEIGPYVVIGKHCQVGAATKIGASTSIGADVKIGDHCLIHASVTLYHGVTIANHVEIHSGAVIGADGFGLANENGQWIPVPQIGGVVIEDHVSIGANTTIDRGTIGDTIIRTGAKLDNQIQIAHNVEIGEHTAIAACTGISGSSKVGKHCILAGGVGVAGHLSIADNTIVTAMTGVSSSLTEPGMYSSGLPAQENREWRRNAVTLRRIDRLVKKVNNLESQLSNTTEK